MVYPSAKYWTIRELVNLLDNNLFTFNGDKSSIYTPYFQNKAISLNTKVTFIVNNYSP